MQIFMSIRACINNSVCQIDTVSLPYPTGQRENPYGNGFTAEKTILKTIKDGQQYADYAKSRIWAIINQ